MNNCLAIILFMLCFNPTNVYSHKVYNDTLIIVVNALKNGDNHKQIQDAFHVQTSKSYLKINLFGEFNIDKTLVTGRDKTIINFCENSKLFLNSEKNGGIAILHNNCEILNGIILGNKNSTNNFYEGYGVLLQGVNNCKIINTTFKDISGNSIFLVPQNHLGCSNNLIENNKIVSPCMDIHSKGDESAILLGYSGDGYFHTNNIIRNNFIDGNNVIKIGVGIIGHGKQNYIEGNTIQNVRNYGILSYESIYTDLCLSKTVIRNNKVENVGEIFPNKTVKGMGIYLFKCPNSIISNNKVVNTLLNSDETETLSQGSIAISMCPNSLIVNNEIDKSFMYGIFCDYSFNSKIKNNKIDNIRKSGVYLVNVNDIIISNNVLKNIDEVVFKGYFENTSLNYIKEQWQIKTYNDIETGNNILIDHNKIYSKNKLLKFVGTSEKVTRFSNKIKNNTFKNNRIFGSHSSQKKLIEFIEEVKKTNKVFNNKFFN